MAEISLIAAASAMAGTSRLILRHLRQRAELRHAAPVDALVAVGWKRYRTPAVPIKATPERLTGPVPRRASRFPTSRCMTTGVRSPRPASMAAMPGAKAMRSESQRADGASRWAVVVTIAGSLRPASLEECAKIALLAVAQLGGKRGRRLLRPDRLDRRAQLGGQLVILGLGPGHDGNAPAWAGRPAEPSSGEGPWETVPCPVARNWHPNAGRSSPPRLGGDAYPIWSGLSLPTCYGPLQTCNAQ